MPQRRVLFFDNSRLAAYCVVRGEVLHEANFAGDDAGRAAFGSYLTEHRHSLFMLLADTTEESYQAEDVPYTTGKDRQAIIRRKLAQHFYGTPYAVAQSQGRLKTGRRDERLLLMALTQPQHLEPWLGEFRRSQAILAGIYALSQTVSGLLPAKPPAQVMLLTLTHAGLRQTFFDAGRMRFSRLTPLIHDATDALAAAAASEAVKMHQYLASQRLIERDQPLTTLILAHPSDTPAIRAHCQNNASLRFDILNLLETARRVGLRTTLISSQADALFCHLLVRQPPREQFAPAEALGFYRLWQARFGLRTAGVLILAGGILFAVNRGLDILKLRDDIEQTGFQARLYQERYATMLQALPSIPISPDDLRLLVDRYDQIVLRAQGPAPLLAQISRSLDAFPAISIDKIEWSIDEQMPTLPADGIAYVDGKTAPVSQSLRGPFAQAEIVARLPLAMVGDQRGQLAVVADFLKHLSVQPDTTAILMQPPLDTQSGKTLKSSDEKGTPEAPRFVFRVIHKL
ncbi:hypothetical protein [Sulfuricystis multivorans]|uniref:hypothetical protein n=1 Tax=Sulfuricystis multivorans TaxID=2211108 RepID=UPI000F824676|nr:hypothetical protein [Sulfuricystis multivorans]